MRHKTPYPWLKRERKQAAELPELTPSLLRLQSPL
jgi:hypothetical protein